MSFSQREHP